MLANPNKLDTKLLLVISKEDKAELKRIAIEKGINSVNGLLRFLIKECIRKNG